jgi:integrase/recombinase XerD
MVIHVRQGKGRKDRDVMLSPTLWTALREYCRRVHPKHWLFPGYSADKPITTKAVFLMIRKAAARAKITKTVSPHVLRHYAASRTMPRVVVRAAIHGYWNNGDAA